LQLAREGWAAFGAQDPTAIESLLAADMTPLPFLRAALIRHLEQFPSVRNGLNRTENETLSVLSTRGSIPLGALFRAVNDAEDAPFMGDTTFTHHVGSLWTHNHPLIELHGTETTDASFARHASITERGRRVFAGAEDWVATSGIDRWLGGVHFHGTETPWRWDESRKTLVSSPRSKST
jgi:hypothetical protein